MDVSRMLSTDWKMFIRELDIPDSEINAIVERYKFDEPWEQKYQCLCHWLNTKGEQATFKQLFEAARKRGQTVLAKDIEAISKGGMPGIMHAIHISLQSCKRGNEWCGMRMSMLIVVRHAVRYLALHTQEVVTGKNLQAVSWRGFSRNYVSALGCMHLTIH